jgi:hypothetical protein
VQSTAIRKHGEMAMAKVIEFYVPTTFRRPLKGAALRCGKVIGFCTQTRKSA